MHQRIECGQCQICARKKENLLSGCAEKEICPTALSKFSRRAEDRVMGQNPEVLMQEILSVLVADQEPSTLTKVTDAIKDYPSKVVCCWSQDAVLDTLLQNQTVDVVLLDLQQPFEKSFELLSDLKAMAPQAEVVFISRFDEEKLWVEAVQRGAYDFLAKPLDSSELKRILLQATEKHHPVKTRTVRAS